ncbi:hypothetical protein E2320_020390 [Naja naja]|nr:hypothetical protein E2320_020390 [Naja naja]
MLFLNFCGKQMFDTARTLLAPQPLNSVTWEALMAKLKNHYTPTPSRIARRHAFHQCEQAEGETVNQFMVGLHCEFKELDDALLDRLVCGLKDLRIQCRLLAKPDLMLQLALDEACAVQQINGRDPWSEQPSFGEKNLSCPPRRGYRGRRQSTRG